MQIEKAMQEDVEVQPLMAQVQAIWPALRSRGPDLVLQYADDKVLVTIGLCESKDPNVGASSFRIGYERVGDSLRDQSLVLHWHTWPQGDGFSRTFHAKAGTAKAALEHVLLLWNENRFKQILPHPTV